jgi:RNA polymerase sigma-70 factor (ECF subfamily)
MTRFFGRKKPANDPDWLRNCLVQNESSLIRYVHHLTRDLELAKDVVQEGFLKLWQEDQQKLAGHEVPWLFTTCRNRAYDILKRKDRKNISADEIALDIPDSTLNAEQLLDQQDDEQRLKLLLEKLTPQQREVIHMKFEQDLSYKQISEITGMSTSHVGVLIHNVVSKLKASAGAKKEAL